MDKNDSKCLAEKYKADFFFIFCEIDKWIFFSKLDFFTINNIIEYILCIS